MNSLIPVLGVSMTIDPPVSSTVAVESPSLHGGLMGNFPSINDYIYIPSPRLDYWFYKLNGERTGKG